MRLERLHISGFKSFPDRADLTFDEGVTAIVGPNGCGKSNVVDAITWVLGEQSAKSLRGDRMEDVIFSGSDSRRPTAAAEVRVRLTGVAADTVRRATDKRAGIDTIAEVAAAAFEQMALPATEARDVEVSRRLYRSGESEYLLDGEVVRLRDVQDLLMDAGLGVKGYAVIEQGKIGQILSAKPTERRTLIEEAAGVTKYKSRRRAAELKLDAAQQNLTRVEDIIFELDRQRSALRRQAAKARRYRKLREELRRWEKVLFARRYRVLAQAIEAHRERLREARERETHAADRLAAVERQLEGLRRELQATEVRATEARARAHACELEKGRREQKRVFDRQQLETLAATTVVLRDELQTLESRVEPGRLELTTRRTASTQAETDREEAARVLTAAEESWRTAAQLVETLESDVEAARSHALAGLNAASALRTAIERAAEARERIAVELTRLDAEAADLQIERERFNLEREQASAELATANSRTDVLRGDRLAREAALAAARVERQRRHDAARTHERELAGIAARLTSLEELEAAREGFGEAAKALLADPALGFSHHGPVADHVETTREHERAVEAALSEVLQAVIVQSRADAERGFDLARDRGLGRCHFLVVDGDADVRDVRAPSGDVVRVSSVIRLRGTHAQLIQRFADRAWIAPSIEAAARAAATTDDPVATPAGDVFRGTHFVAGGARVEARGILATKREIKELRERLTAARTDAERAAQDATLADATAATTESELTAVGADLHVQEKAIVAREMEVKRAADELERVTRKSEQNDSERRRAEEERRALETRQDEARESLAALEGQQRTRDAEVAGHVRRLIEAREAAAAESRQTADAKAAHAGLVERALALGAEVGRLEASARELEARIASRTDEFQRTTERHVVVGQELETTERQLVDDVRTFDELAAAVSAVEAEAAALAAGFAGEEGDARGVRVALDEARAQVGQLDVARATAEADLTHLSSSCVETLQATIDDVVAEVEAQEREGQASPDVSVIFADETDGEDDAETEAAAVDGTVTDGAVTDGAVMASPEEPAVTSGVTAPAEVTRTDEAAGLAARALTAEEAIAALRFRIDRLGPVNMMAIEQFDELEQRHTFLSNQRQDLVDSIAATGEAIKRIEKTTRERFREAFAAINKYFEETFTTLFGGGRAGLVLLDENDMLESGIDIIAQPLGKRLQNVQLLSGGEKALTAMALLFAMFRYRPSPFCLLDEIDAPLDDANIGRFLEMLRGMLDRTQFIVVTHSRKTMEMADRLYGVTMEEPGVSKLISVRLN